MKKNNDKEINEIMEKVLEDALEEMKKRGMIEDTDMLDNIALEKFEQASNEDFEIILSRKDGHNRISIEGGRLTLLIALAGCEKAILEKTNTSEEMFEFIKDHVGVELV